jgi:multidrug efflux pump subunit AcrA (membrane-fusion protein)
MKTRILLAFLILAVVSCGKKDDKAAKIEKLKGERDKISVEITKLEDELVKEGKGTLSTNIVSVQVKTITPMSFKHYIEVQGKIDGEENVSVSAEAMGVIKSVNVKAGQTVRKGQVLAEIDAEFYTNHWLKYSNNFSLLLIFITSRKAYGIKRSDQKFSF